MPRMRRVAAAIAVSALVGATALPALAALCCASAPSRACCAKGDEERGTALEHAPCCKIDAVKDAARERVLPRTSSGSAIAVPAVAPHLSHAALLTADARRPACMLIPASTPLGPPLRLRI
jgi:hypothetical protein